MLDECIVWTITLAQNDCSIPITMIDGLYKILITNLCNLNNVINLENKDGKL